jgi:hypothetical protein
MRIAILVALAITFSVPAQDKPAADSRRVVEPETRRSPEEMAAAASRAVARHREKLAREKAEKAAAESRKAEEALLAKMTPEERAAYERLEEMRRHVEKTEAWLKALDEAKALEDAKRRAENEASLERRRAQAKEDERKRWSDSTEIGVRRAVASGKSVFVFSNYFDCNTFDQLVKASDSEGSQAFASRKGRRADAGIEFVVLEHGLLCKVRATNSGTDDDIVWIRLHDLLVNADRTK